MAISTNTNQLHLTNVRDGRSSFADFKWENHIRGKVIMNEYIEDETPIDIGRILYIIWSHKWITFIFLFIFVGIAILYSPTQDEKYKSNFVVFKDNNVKVIEDAQDNHKSIDTKSTFWLEVMSSSSLYDIILEQSQLELTPYELSQIIIPEYDDKDGGYYQVNLEVDHPSYITPIYQSFMIAVNEMNYDYEVRFYKDRVKYLKKRFSENQEKILNIDKQLREQVSGMVFEKIETLDDYHSATQNFRKELDQSKIELAGITASMLIIRKEITGVSDTLLEESSFTEPLKVQLMNLYVDLAKAETKYGSYHPTVLGIEENIEHVRNMMDGDMNQSVEIKNIVSNPTKTNLFAQNIELKIRKHSLEAKIGALDKLLSTNAPDNANNEVYRLIKTKDPLVATNAFIEKKIIDLEINMNNIPDKFICIDKPKIPVESDRKPMYFFIAAGVMLGLFFGISSVLIYDFLSGKVTLVRDFSSISEIPVIGIIPKAKHLNFNFSKDKEETKEDAILANAFTRISINIRQLISNEKGNIITIFSGVRGDGKTSTAALLSQKLTESNKKVILIDFDIFIPRLSKNFNMEKEAGLLNYLLDKSTSVDDIIHSTELENLDIIPKGQNSYSANVYLESSIIDSLLANLKSRYDYIILDTPAINPKPQVFFLLKKSNFNLLVTRMENSTKRDVKAVEETVKSLETPIGAILTNVSNDPFSRDNYYQSYYEYYYE